MLDLFYAHPALVYVVATLLPVVPVALMLLSGAVKNLARSAASCGRIPAWTYRLLGGDRPQVWGAYLSVVCVALSAVLAIVGLVSKYDPNYPAAVGIPEDTPRSEWPTPDFYFLPHWSERVEWIRIGATPSADKAAVLTLDCTVSGCNRIMFAMVTVIATLIFVFSLGYMNDERGVTVVDHEAHVERRGRFGRYFVYMSLFVASMLNLLIAENLFQIFVSWELVGVCSFFLIGFYHERRSAASAAVKAFVVNRVGDAGFLVGIVVAWSTFGTLSLWSLYSDVVPLHIFWEENNYPTEVIGLLIGLGIFLGCVGKSAQVPLHVWLPDAMAGPTPVSALIHAATMVAAGVYLASTCSFLFVAEVRLVIAYTGAVTAFFAATVACAQTDIKKVMAYSTCSQLGLMVLAIGVEDETAALFHLITHAFFKALLFLAAGSVIHGMSHEQDIRNMGGLLRTMPITAFTMLVGVLAICGFPMMSGWYSKGAILGAAWEYAEGHPTHIALFAVPLMTTGLTAFYMFRLWFLVFLREPRDRDANVHAHESPLLMTTPLVILAAFSIAVGWGWPVWEPDASVLLRLLEPSRNHYSAAVHASHVWLEVAIGMISAAGFGLAVWLYLFRSRVPGKPGTLTLFFARAWYFDALYRVLIVRPAVALASVVATADKRPGFADGTGSDPAAARFDFLTLDGWLSAVGLSAAATGAALRRLQTGHVRGYVLALGLTVVGLLGMLAALNR